MINLIPYFSHEKTQERKTKKEEEQKNIDAFWEKFDKLGLEDKEWVFYNYLGSGPSAEIITNEEADEFEKKDKEMHYLLVNGLRPKTLRKKSKSRIKQEKIKLEKQQELQSALLPDTEFDETQEDENEHQFGSGSEDIKK